MHAVQQRHGVSVGLGGGDRSWGGGVGKAASDSHQLCCLLLRCPSGSGSPQTCEMGTYSPAGSAQCLACPLGHACPQPSDGGEDGRERAREREAGSAFGLTGCAFDPFPAHHTRTHGLLCWLLCRQPQLHDLHGMVCRQPRSALNPPALQTISRSVRPATRVRMRVYRLQSAVVATTRRRARSAVCSARLDPRMWTEKEGGGGISPYLQQPVGRFLHSLSSCVSGSSAAVACGSGTYSASGASACSNCPLGHECPLPSDGESELIGFSL